MAGEAAVSTVAVIGGGAIGGVLAEAACAAGHDVTVAGAARPGLHLSPAGGARAGTARVR